MQFARLAHHFDLLEATAGRLDMTRIVASMLAELDAGEFGVAMRLLGGQVAPDWEGVEVGLAEKQVLVVLARLAGMDPARGGVEHATAVYHEVGDLGAAAQRLMETKGGARQVGLMTFASGAPGDAAPAALSIGQVHARLHDLALLSGPGSQEERQERLRALLADVSPREARYIVRVVAGRLRLGVADMTVLDALAAWHLGRGVRSVVEMEPPERAEHEDVRARLERAYDLRSDLATVAQALADGGMAAVDALGIEPGTPLRPMAAERLKTLGEILAKQAPGGGAVGMEYKYDGLRVQAHLLEDGSVRLFSRRLEDLTGQFPDVVDALGSALAGHVAVVEGEAVALDEQGRFRPFQDISRRRGRKTGLGADVQTLSGAHGRAGRDITQEIPVTLFLFDLLLVDGKEMLGEPLHARRQALEALVPSAPGGHAPVRCSTFSTATDVADMEAFFQEAVERGAEGIMCKQLDHPYKAGSRGFGWIKFKTDYDAQLVDTMDLVVVGAFRGRGRRAGWYGALLCAARNAQDGSYETVCKLGTGFDDATLSALADRLAPHVVPACPPNVLSAMEPDVWLAPAQVLEVQAAGLTLSPVHKAAWGRIRGGAGLAARFPRFTGWRDDKDPAQATDVEELLAMHAMQSADAADEGAAHSGPSAG